MHAILWSGCLGNPGPIASRISASVALPRSSMRAAAARSGMVSRSQTMTDSISVPLIRIARRARKRQQPTAQHAAFYTSSLPLGRAGDPLSQGCRLTFSALAGLFRALREVVLFDYVLVGTVDRRSRPRPAYSFSEWPIPLSPFSVPGSIRSGTIMAASSMSACPDEVSLLETPRRNTPQGIYTRLQSHAGGRRSGDQFCVYVADRLALPALTQEDIAAIASGRHQMDAFVRRYIHENLVYRFVMLPDGAAAYALEAAIKSGGWDHGRPLLNPGR